MIKLDFESNGFTGRAAFYWSMCSGLGIFMSGASLAIATTATKFYYPTQHITQFDWTIMDWGAMITCLGGAFLALTTSRRRLMNDSEIGSLTFEGYNLFKVLQDEHKRKPSDVSFWQHLKRIRNPFTLAVILEDVAAVSGVAVATAGIAATHYTGLIYYDTLAGLGVGMMMAGVGVKIAGFNRQYLIGLAVDDHYVRDIEKILISRPSISAVRDITTQWVGPRVCSLLACFIRVLR